MFLAYRRLLFRKPINFALRVSMWSSRKSKEGVFLKRSVYIAALSAMVVLVFAAIASAQDSMDQSSSDPNSTSTDQAQSPPPSQQEEAAPSGQAPSDQNAPTVSIAANAFDPAQVEVAAGTPLTFVNDDSVAHTVSLDGLFDTPEIPAGSSYPVTLDGAGTVTYHDEANPEMQGTITVGEAS